MIFNVGCKRGMHPAPTVTNKKIVNLLFMNLLNRTMIKYKTAEEIEIMRQAALVVSRTLGLIAAELRPGVTPLEQYTKVTTAIMPIHLRWERFHPNDKNYSMLPKNAFTLVLSRLW